MSGAEPVQLPNLYVYFHAIFVWRIVAAEIVVALEDSPLVGSYSKSSVSDDSTRVVVRATGDRGRNMQKIRDRVRKICQVQCTTDETQSTTVSCGHDLSQFQKFVLA